MGAIESIKTNPNHIEISASEYADPFNKVLTSTSLTS